MKTTLNLCKRLQKHEKRIDFDIAVTYNLIIKGNEEKSKSLDMSQRVCGGESKHRRND